VNREEFYQDIKNHGFIIESQSTYGNDWDPTFHIESNEGGIPISPSFFSLVELKVWWDKYKFSKVS